MNLILCCSIATLRERWVAPLAPLFAVYQASSLQDLSILVRQKISFDLLVLHRPLVDASIIKYIRQSVPTCRLFILSDRPNEEEGLDFIRLGAVGYANSYSNPERLREAINVVASGAVWVHQKLMQRLIEETIPKQPNATETTETVASSLHLGQLSDREYQIAGLIGNGLSNVEIAAQLGITERTVKAHLSSIYAKTSTSGRLGLALLINQAAHKLPQ